MFDNMRAKWRENHPKKIDPYDAEEAKLHELLAKLEAGTVEYAEAQAQLKNVNCMRADHRESKRRISKEDRGGIIKKIVGGAITIGGTVLLCRYEMKGNTFTGEKRSLADSFVNVLGRFFKGGD